MSKVTPRGDLELEIGFALAHRCCSSVRLKIAAATGDVAVSRALRRQGLKAKNPDVHSSETAARRRGVQPITTWTLRLVNLPLVHAGSL